ncbi:MAG: substrate-binding periplasmic protein [Tateyamaria sp.]
MASRLCAYRNRFGWLHCTIAILLVATSVRSQPVDEVVAAHYPPLMIDGATDRPGYAVEVLFEAARRAGRDITVTFYPFERAIHAIVNKDAVLMPSLFQGKNYDDDIMWVAEIQRAELRFASISGRVDTLQQARDLPIIVAERGTTSERLLNSLGFENLQTTRSPTSSAQMLAAQRADAWLLTERLMRSTWTRLDMATPLTVGDIVHEVPVFLAASLSLPDDVAHAYAEAIHEMDEDGTLDRILSRYAQ